MDLGLDYTSDDDNSGQQQGEPIDLLPFHAEVLNEPSRPSPRLSYPVPEHWQACACCNADGNWCIPYSSDGSNTRIACHVVLVKESSEEYQAILERFQKTAKSLILRGVRRVQNYETYCSFMWEQDKLRMRGQDPNVWGVLYHTTKGALADVLREGLDCRVGTTGLMGAGIYATDSIIKASAYWKQACNRRIMLQCSMALGRSFELPPGESRRTLRREPSGYDSVVGNFTGQNEMIVYHNARAHIDYIIDYEVTPGYVDEAGKEIKVVTPAPAPPPPPPVDLTSQLMLLTGGPALAGATAAPNTTVHVPFKTGTAAPAIASDAPKRQCLREMKRDQLTPSTGSAAGAHPTACQPKRARAVCEPVIQAGITSVSISKDNRLLVVGSYDGKVYLWRLTTVTTGLTSQPTPYEPLDHINSRFELWKVMEHHSAAVQSVAFSPDGQCIASAGNDKQICLWSFCAIGQQSSVRPLNGHRDTVSCVVFSPDGRYLVSSSKDEDIRFWEVSTGQPVRVLLGHFADVRCLAYSPQGNMLASGSDDATICLWDLTGHKGDPILVLRQHRHSINSLSFSPCGHFLVSASKDNTVRLWSVSTGLCSAVYQDHTTDVRGVAYSPDGRTIALAASDNTVRLWDVKTCRVGFTLLGHSAAVQAVAFTGNGECIISGSSDKTVRLWNTATGMPFSQLLLHNGLPDK